MNLYLLKWNNYYNRQYKKLNTLAEYEPYILDAVEGKSLNFNPGDGVNTTHIVNYSGEEQPNYLLITDDDGTIKSRWFIIDSDFTRKGQAELSLHRDVVADNYNEIINAPCFIEKATVPDSSPFIFNKEDMDFNQIKQAEIPIKDKTGVPWIVGYYARKSGEGITHLQGDVAKDIPFDIEANSMTDWAYADYVDGTAFKGKMYSAQSKLEINFLWKNYDGNGWPNKCFDIPFGFDTVQLRDSSYPNIDINLVAEDDTLDQIKKLVVDTWKGSLGMNIGEVEKNTKNWFGTHTYDEENAFKNLNGKIVKFTGNNTFYRITIRQGETQTERQVVKYGSGLGATFNFIDGKMKGIHRWGSEAKLFSGNTSDNRMTQNNYFIQAHYDTYYLELEMVEGSSLHYDIPTMRYHLTDAPYDMFCMPYAESFVVRDGSNSYTMSKDMSFSVAMAIAEKYTLEGAKFLYDLQLLPYCPISSIIEENGSINTKGVIDAASYITEDGKKVGMIFHASHSSFSFTVPLENPIYPTEKKIQNETEIQRLCSPNYNGVFEFSVVKNDGLTAFDVDCSYIPFNPYIHVAPSFGGLYGRDYDDSRGLTCGGDFSLPIVSNAWEGYQLSNKNYDAVFRREIQNMEVNNAAQREQEKWGRITGIAQGAMSGGIMGGSINGKAAVAGAVAGGAISYFAGQADKRINEQLRNEALDYKNDMYGYSLGNIKALPNTISKTTAYTANNKIFPFLELYSATEEEKQALRDKIKYNGMTVMAIGKIADYLQPEPSYIKGKIIRLENIDDDFHLSNTIADEINKGLFI